MRKSTFNLFFYGAIAATVYYFWRANRDINIQLGYQKDYQALLNNWDELSMSYKEQVMNNLTDAEHRFVLGHLTQEQAEAFYE